MKFNNLMGIDPIVGSLIGYTPTPTDKLNFLAQIQAIEDNINKYWPKDDSWNIYEIETEDETEQINIKFENIKHENKMFNDIYKKPKENVTFVMERCK